MAPVSKRTSVDARGQLNRLVDNVADHLYQRHGYFSSIWQSGIKFQTSIVGFLRYFPALWAPLRCLRQGRKQKLIRATGLGCLRTRRMLSRRILRAVRTFGNGDKVPGIVAIQATAAHYVGRDLPLRSAHSKFTANQMTGHDCGLG